VTRRIDEVQPVASAPADTAKVYFGAEVSVIDDDGSESRYRIVGADEIDPKRHWISVDAPLARALLGRAMDDRVSVETPAGRRNLEIVGIDYDEWDGSRE